MNTPSVEYLPGDRVMTHEFPPIAGTVTSGPIHVYVLWDNLTRSVLAKPEEIARQPIEPGCSVRWVDPSRYDISGGVVDKIKDGRAFFCNSAMNVALDDVVRITTELSA